MACSEITETAVQELGILDLNRVPGDKVDVTAGCNAHELDIIGAKIRIGFRSIQRQQRMIPVMRADRVSCNEAPRRMVVLVL